ncbi:MAG: phage/plasmid primase, P4 family [Planctomycetota bacterium]
MIARTGINTTHIPPELKALRRWVVWKHEDGTKVLYRAEHPSRRASSTDPNSWSDFETALSSYATHGYAGIGIALGELDDGRVLAGVDLDDCIVDGEVVAEAQGIIDKLNTYTEISPSGDGVKSFLYGRKPASRTGCQVDPPSGTFKRIEIYDTGRWFTVTGERMTDAAEVRACNGDFQSVCEQYLPAPRAVKLAKPIKPEDMADAERRCMAYLAKVDDAISGQGGHSATLRAACECFRFGLDRDAAERCMDWFNASKCEPAWSAAELAHKLDDAEDKVTADREVGCRLKERVDATQKAHEATPMIKAGLGGDTPTATAPILSTPEQRAEQKKAKKLAKLDPATPYNTARAFIADRYGTEPRTLHHWRGDFYSYDGLAYSIATADRLRAELYQYVAGQFAPTKTRTANLIDAAKAATYLPESISSPAWLGDTTDKPDAAECVPMANGVLHMPTRTLHPIDPSLFALNALSFDYNPDATCPAWLSFLDSVWPEDVEQSEALQDWLGYLLSGDTRQQKVALIVGPKRSGKGTIARVMSELMGRENVCAPTLAGLATNFGLAPLIGKTAATVSDARLSGRADQAAIAERLLTISGEDGITIDRKHRDAWTGRLGVRFTIMSNELPRLADASGALASRFVVLTMRQSFYGREDAGLTSRLLNELPGIFNWSLAGLDRLRERGHFIQPSSSEDAIAELAELGSPVGAFVEDCCVVEAGATVNTDTLYREWSKWCDENGRSQPGTAQSFGRDLRAAVGGIVVRRPRLESGDRVRVYEGIRPRF